MDKVLERQLGDKFSITEEHFLEVIAKTIRMVSYIIDTELRLDFIIDNKNQWSIIKSYPPHTGRVLRLSICLNL